MRYILIYHIARANYTRGVEDFECKAIVADENPSLIFRIISVTIDTDQIQTNNKISNLNELSINK